MANTQTTTGIVLIEDGAEAGSWGDITNTNLEIVNRLTSEGATITLSGTTHSLQIADGVLSDGQYAAIVFVGSPSGTNTVTVSPNDAQRVFVIKNSSGESVVMTQGSGSDVTIPDGLSAIVYCDGQGSGASVVSLIATDNYAVTTNNLSDLTDSDAAIANLGITATVAELNYLDITTLGVSEAEKALTANASGDVAIGGDVVIGGSLGVVGSFGVTGQQSGNISAVAALDIDCSAANYFTKTVSTNSAFTFSNAPASYSYGFTLEVTHTGGDITWPTAVKWPNDISPDLITGKTHLFMFVTDDGGSRWRGAALANYTD